MNKCEEYWKLVKEGFSAESFAELCEDEGELSEHSLWTLISKLNDNRHEVTLEWIRNMISMPMIAMPVSRIKCSTQEEFYETIFWLIAFGDKEKAKSLAVLNENEIGVIISGSEQNRHYDLWKSMCLEQVKRTNGHERACYALLVGDHSAAAVCTGFLDTLLVYLLTSKNAFELLRSNMVSSNLANSFNGRMLEFIYNNSVEAAVHWAKHQQLEECQHRFLAHYSIVNGTPMVEDYVNCLYKTELLEYAPTYIKYMPNKTQVFAEFVSHAPCSMWVKYFSESKNVGADPIKVAESIMLRILQSSDPEMILHGAKILEFLVPDAEEDFISLHLLTLCRLALDSENPKLLPHLVMIPCKQKSVELQEYQELAEMYQHTGREFIELGLKILKNGAIHDMRSALKKVTTDIMHEIESKNLHEYAYKFGKSLIDYEELLDLPNVSLLCKGLARTLF